MRSSYFDGDFHCEYMAVLIRIPRELRRGMLPSQPPLPSSRDRQKVQKSGWTKHIGGTVVLPFSVRLGEYPFRADPSIHPLYTSLRSTRDHLRHALTSDHFQVPQSPSGLRSTVT